MNKSIDRQADTKKVTICVDEASLARAASFLEGSGYLEGDPPRSVTLELVRDLLEVLGSSKPNA